MKTLLTSVFCLWCISFLVLFGKAYDRLYIGYTASLVITIVLAVAVLAIFILDTFIKKEEGGTEASGKE